MKDELHIYHNKKIITKHKITNNLLNIKPEHELFYPVNKETEELKSNSQIMKELKSVNYD